MKVEELLRHVADNVEAGRRVGHGLLFLGGVSSSTSVNGVAFDSCADYTLAPNTVTINGIEVERGVTVEPVNGMTYFTPAIHTAKLHRSRSWRSDGYDKECFCRGLAFLDKNKAEDMAKAMLAFQNAEG